MVALLVGWAWSVVAVAQDYHFPIAPGNQAFLSGTMGELRATHFHAGIDIKTNSREGWPVHATSSGYVSRVKVSTGGYGHAVYLTHDDGNTSVYAHLQRFHPTLEAELRRRQYEEKAYTVEFFPEKDEIRFEKGEVLAWSGNTGGSFGPHLHFEIRDGYQRPLNPLEFGFEEVHDQIAPTLVSLAVRPLQQGARVKGQYARQDYDILKSGGEYKITQPIPVYGQVGLEVYSFDRQNGSLNRNGYPDLELYVDDVLVWRQHLNRFSFNDSKGIYVHYNYPVSRNTGRRFAKLYLDDGNPLDFYQPGAAEGKVTITDTGLHKVRIIARDTYGNESVLRATLQGTGPQAKATGIPPFSNDEGYYIEDNTLVYYVKGSGCEDNTVYANRRPYTVEPDYRVGDYTVFLWDLRKGLPDSSRFCGVEQNYRLKMQVPSAGRFRFYDEHATYDFPAGALFDTAYLEAGYTYDRERDLELFSIGGGLVPLKRGFTMELKPTKEYNEERAQVYSVDGMGNYGFAGGEWQPDGTISFSAGFDTYTILEDSVPPTIKPYWVNAQEFRFRIDDELSGIATYDAWLNGEWVLMYYEYKNHQVWSKKLDEDKPFQGELVIKVTDNAGNETTYETKIE